MNRPASVTPARAEIDVLCSVIPAQSRIHPIGTLLQLGRSLSTAETGRSCTVILIGVTREVNMKAAGYLRVSTDAQAGEDRFGLESQTQAIQKFAEDQGYDLTSWYTDAGVSG